tara:strand:- start:54 stop:308 length:255 start_codon:yes stop_codon:yes gene_type:complete
MTISESTFDATSALVIVDQGMEFLNNKWNSPDERLQASSDILLLMSTLTEEYGPEYFMDEEIITINNAMVQCINTIGAHSDTVE